MKIAREMGELFNKLRDETVKVSALNLTSGQLHLPPYFHADVRNMDTRAQ